MLLLSYPRPVIFFGIHRIVTDRHMAIHTIDIDNDMDTSRDIELPEPVVQAL